MIHPAQAGFYRPPGPAYSRKHRTEFYLPQVPISGVLGQVKSAGPLARNSLAEMRTLGERRSNRPVRLDVRGLRIRLHLATSDREAGREPSDCLG
jgi:hypothetical protein